MFYNKQTEEQQEKYKKYLQTIGSLSNLFSDSTTPYLYYRIAEKMFCKAFNANDLSRGDVSYDAKKGSLGIGLKTFLRSNDKSIQKIAEFNKNINDYKHLNDIKKIQKISELRNARIDFTNNSYDIKSSLYHCIVRDKNRFCIYEEENKKIDIDFIKNIKKTKSSIFFDDGISEYSFSLSKSTLMKRFNTNKFIDKFKDYFFPNKDTIFTLTLPNQKIIQAKICQENKKALMSNPNKDLGKWLLRDIFKLNEGELLNNNHLKLYGIDSVRIDKTDDLKYEINFAKTDSFEEFINNLEN